MANTRQHSINFHGQHRNGLESLSGSLLTGEIAVVTSDINLAIKGDDGKLHYFIDSAATHNAINACGQKVTDLSATTMAFSAATVAGLAAASADTKAVETKVTTLSGATVAGLAAASADTKAVETKLIAVSAATLAADSKITELSAATRNDFVKDIDIKKASDGSLSGKTCIFLYNAKEEEIGRVDATEFVVDGMLSAVTFDNSAHTMTFIWNTDAGGKEITVDLDEIIAPYQADEQTINLGEGNTFSAIMDQENGVASFNTLTSFSAATKAGFVTASADTKAVETKVTALSGATVAGLAAASADTKAVETKVTALSGATVAGLATASADTKAVETKVNTFSAATVGELNNIEAAIASADTRLETLEAEAAAAVKSVEIQNLSGVTGTYTPTNGNVAIDFSEMIIDCGTWDEPEP